MRTRIILVSGRAGAGKDTFAAQLTQVLDPQLTGQVYTIPFARRLKELACEVWGMNLEYLSTYDGKAKYRGRLVQLGQTLRAIDPHVWVDYVARHITAVYGHDRVFIIPDCRFLNEIWRMLATFDRRVLLVRVSSTPAVRLARMGAVRAREYVESGLHLDPSEAQLDLLERASTVEPTFDEAAADAVRLTRFAHVLENNGTPAEFTARVQDWAAEWMTGYKEWQLAAAAAYRLSRHLGPEAKLYLESGISPAAVPSGLWDESAS